MAHSGYDILTQELVRNLAQFVFILNTLLADILDFVDQSFQLGNLVLALELSSLQNVAGLVKDTRLVTAVIASKCCNECRAIQMKVDVNNVRQQHTRLESVFLRVLDLHIKTTKSQKLVSCIKFSSSFASKWERTLSVDIFSPTRMTKL